MTTHTPRIPHTLDDQAAPSPGDGPAQCVHRIFEMRAQEMPDQMAVIYPARDSKGRYERLSYRDLNRRANRLARQLQAQGVGHQMCVAILAEPSVDMVVGMLAVLKAGAAYLPLDLQAPDDRKAFMLADAQASLLLKQPHLPLPTLPAKLPVVSLTADQSLNADEDPHNLSTQTDPEDLIYVMYTSGSTGVPKGVAVRHASVHRLVREQNYIAITPGDRIGQGSTVAFDAATFEIWGALLNGATVVGLSRETMLSPRELAMQLRRQEISILFLTTALFNQMAGIVPDAFRDLRCLLFGGEAVSPRCVAEVLAHGAPEHLLHVYGPTECTTYATWYRVTRVPDGARTIPIGAALAGTTLHVLDADRRPVDSDEAGELYIGGAGLARGYLNRPDLTAERFVPAPWDQELTLYRTGDLVRRLADGNIEFVGRIDNQVKLRGFRIELGEIEAALAAHPGIHQAVAHVHEHLAGEKMLVAYVVLRGDAAPEVSAWREWLRERLPAYMVPQSFTCVSALPLNANGKVDRRALPEPVPAEDAVAAAAQTAKAPETPTEIALAGIWSRVLRLPVTNVHDNFFDRGGHSLLAVQVMAAVERELGRHLPVGRFFTLPTLSQQAQWLDEEGVLAGSEDVGANASAMARGHVFPLSGPQRQLWLFEQLHPAQAVYNETLVFHMHERIDCAAMTQALDLLIERHEAFRTTFTTIEGEPRQIVHAEQPVRLRTVDLGSLPQAERVPAAHGLATAELLEPFDLEQGPLLRFTLVKFADAEWRLYLAAHHLILDGVSMYAVFLQELEVAYRARLAGQAPAWSRPPAQAADFAVWQEHHLGDEALREQLSYWKRQLANLPVLQLPTDRPAAAKASYRGARECLQISAELTRQLKDLSRQEGVTLFVTLAAALNVLLHRYTGQDDIVIGTVHGGRSRWEWQKTVGNFLNNLVLRTNVAGDPDFRELLARVKTVLAEAYQHPDLPFEKLVKALQPERLTFQNPLFQVALVMEPPLPQEGVSWGLSQLDIHSGTAKFDLLVELDERPEGIVGRIEYSTELFEPASIVRFIGHLQTLLEGIVAQPRQAISRLPLLSTPELQQILGEWNNTAVDYPSGQCLHQLFEAQVLRTPDAAALVFERHVLTYAELNARANQLAHRLKALGVGPDTLVAVCLHRCVEMVVALYGILKAGGAYVPVDPDYPRERQAFMLDDARVPVLLTQRPLADELPTHGASVLCLDEEWSPALQDQGEDIRCGTCPTHNPNGTVTEDHLAYAIYTSGSTGQPKGALIPHRGIRNRLQWMQAAFPLTSDDVVLQKTPFSFDVSVWEFFWPLLVGARLVIARPEGHKDSAYLCGLIEREQVTTVHFVPSMLQLFLDSADAERCRSLRRVMCSGEALPFEVQQQFFAAFPEPTELHNLYGPTEASVDVSWWACERNGARSVVPIGRPIANTQLYILDGQGQVVPMGVPGELYIGGVGVGRGYLNRPALTTERFVNWTQPATGRTVRLYRTGDLCRWLPDGAIDYLGRLDHQVKIRGLRIELGEIESALRRCRSVRDAVVVVREDRPGDKRLVAYCVPQGEDEPSVEDLRRQLKAQLPEFMVPAAFVSLPVLPLSANGKLDRRALPAPDRGRTEASECFVAPRTPVEAVLAGIWAELLDVDEVGVTESFFDMGGDSMRAIRVIAAARRQGLELSVSQLFQHPTVAGLAALVQRVTAQAETPATSAFELLREDDRQRLPKDLEDAYPLSWLQAGMVFHSEADPGTDVYHDLMGSRVDLPLDTSALRQSLQTLVDRHPVLRTRLALRGFNEPLQLVQHATTLPLVVEDLRHLQPQEQDRVIDEWFAVEKHRAFDWEAAPPWLVHVHHRGSTCFNLTLSFHHILLEGWSIASFLAELFALYLRALGRSDRELPPPPSSRFRDFVAHERRVVRSADAREYWSERVRHLSQATLPRWPSAWRTGCPPGVVDISVDPGLADRLRQFARQARVPLKSVLLAAHLRALQLQVGQARVCTGLVTNTRPATPDAERVLGLYLNTLPFGLTLADGSWTELVQVMFRQEQQDIAFRDYPLGEIQRQAGRPLFESIFNIVHFHVYQDLMRHEGLGGLNSKVFQRTNFPLLSSFVLHARSGQLERIVMDYDGAEVCRGQAEVIGASYLDVLAAMCNAPQARHDTCRLASVSPLVDASALGSAEVGGLPALFEAQVERTPDAVALVARAPAWAGRQMVRWTYRELNARANRMAHYLRSQGVGPESRVGICVERTPEMLVSMLAILKAGGAYVPFDHRHPTARLTAMMTDSGIRCLVTESHLEDRLPGWTGRTLCLDRDAAVVASQPSVNPQPSAAGSQLAYVLYTSGSTGVPKGIAIEHRQAVNLMQWARETYVTAELSGVLAATSLSFDLSVFEIFVPLSWGGRVVLADDILGLPTLEARDEVTLVNAVPSAITQGWVAQLPGSVRVVNLAGEPLKAAVVSRLYERPTVEKVFNLYGPTETTTYATGTLIPRGTTRGITIGRPIRGTEIHILDERRHPVPVGVPGEIHIGGAGLARGYLNRADLDRERFIAHPYRAEAGGRLYRSGDLGRWLPDGTIEYLGRLDRQVKLRGLRIELPEIEAVLMQHPGVEDAVVVIREDGQQEPYLAAYVVPSDVEDQARDATAIGSTCSELLKQHLPGCMVPRRYAVLDRLPLNVNGKVELAALPEPPLTARPPAHAAVLPRNAVEEALVELWKELLKFEELGVHDNFFDLGGHSLMAMELVARAGGRGVVLSIQQLYQWPTVAELALAVECRSAASLLLM